MPFWKEYILKYCLDFSCMFEYLYSILRMFFQNINYFFNINNSRFLINLMYKCILYIFYCDDVTAGGLEKDYRDDGISSDYSISNELIVIDLKEIVFYSLLGNNK